MVWGCRAVVRLPDPKLKTLGERGNECIFVGYAKNFKAFKFYVIEPNEFVLIKCINESRDAIFDENSFSSIPKLRWRSLINGTDDDIDVSEVLDKVSDEVVVHQPELRKSKKNRTLKFSMKDMGEVDVILVSTPMDTSEKLRPNNGQVVSQLEYSMVIACLMYVMTCTRPDIAFVVGKMNNSLTSGWVFFLGEGAISWASKKQTCITSSTMASEFVALVAVGKEAKWLRNVILEISLWSKHISPISICCDSAATLVKAYCQMYNGKSRHLGVKHSMICELHE
ncbi:hypothetical protein Tco_0111218 [Tanacetum coccineum]